MLYEDLRLMHEDIERLEEGIADRILDNPKQSRTRLAREHEIAVFLSRITEQSERAIEIYKQQQERLREIQSISTGDTFPSFYNQLSTIKDFHKRNPNQGVENLEKAYQKAEAQNLTTLFSGEEAYGRFFDLTLFHDEYLNLPGVRGQQRLTYLQYVDAFDDFPLTRSEKLTDQYFAYITGLSDYLESFLRKTKPLEDLDKLFTGFNTEFDDAWTKNSIPGWQSKQENGVTTQEDGVWCADCQKSFSNDNTYRSHLSGKKHIKNAQARAGGVQQAVERPKERALAEREYRIRKLATTMQSVRSDTRNNIERKAGMTEKERQQELEMLEADEEEPEEEEPVDDDIDENGDKIYNPLKLPLAWDGKPIPFWLYKLHGLGVEFTCEICGNFVYMGRRAFEKHFSEARHIYGLKCLGVTNTSLFREITTIKEAEDLWRKLQADKVAKKDRSKDIVEMEDYSGTVMPLAVYEDLAKEGLL